MSHQYLQVPFSEKNDAKQLGARWDAMARAWFVPEGVDVQHFARWLPSTALMSVEPSRQSALLSTPTETKGMSLSGLLAQVSAEVAGRFAEAVWVRAEITELSTRQGHVYLSLSESEQGQLLAQAKASIWAQRAAGLLSQFAQVAGQPLAPGLAVLVLVEVSFHVRFGLTLSIVDIDASFTLGDQLAKLNAMRLQLQQAQLYALNRQHAMPDDLFRVAVLSPQQAAGLGDFRSDAKRLEALGLCQFVYFEASFQGDKTETELLQALQAVLQAHRQQGFDVLVIIRGGGAKQDLMQLNLLSIAQTICRFPIPVWTGIGHERDLTLLDEVAHRHFDTPSKVIAHIRQSIVQSAQQAQQHWRLIVQQSRLQLKQAKQQIQHWQHRMEQQAQQLCYQQQLVLQAMHQQIQNGVAQRQYQLALALSQAQQQLLLGVKRQTEQARQQLVWQQQIVSRQSLLSCRLAQQNLAQYQQWLTSIHPKRWLASGYALVKQATNQQWLTSVHQISQDETLVLTLHDGEVLVQVTDIKAKVFGE